MSIKEYDPDESFNGVIGNTLDESSPSWPKITRAKKDAPNVVVFAWDDVGYGQLSPFGGLCNTPTMDRLAKGGLRYSNFQTTALCSPTRGSLLTGRNHHKLGLSAITELSLGYPGHNGYMGFEHGFISEILKQSGYNTFAVGKWHLAPAVETGPGGPFTRWPLGRGFERYYGFLGGDTDQWFPDLTHDNHAIKPPASPEDGYHLNIDLADKAINFVKDATNNAPDRPFFLYYAPGAGHAPHHVEKEWIEKQKGKFDMGWDEYRKKVYQQQLKMGLIPPGTPLSERDPDIPAWDSLSEEAKRMYCRQMEVYAAFLEQTDYHFGRFIDFLEKSGRLENTIVVVISDNGASAEGDVHGTFNEALFFNGIEEKLEDNLKHFDEWGAPGTFPHYSWGWTWAGDTPFRRWKRETYRGGTSDPCIVSWPKGIKARGEVRQQYTYVTDIAPTILEALDIKAPKKIRGVTQSPMDGVSFAHTFEDDKAESKHRTQYFEMFGHRSIYHDGWRAVCPFPGTSFAEAAKKDRYFGMPLTNELLRELDMEGWELYYVTKDLSETKNLAKEEPAKLREMIQRWYSEAGKYNVFPLASADLRRMNAERPSVARPRDRYVYYPGSAPIAFAAAPQIYNCPYSISADVEIPEGGAEGIILCQGSRSAGWALFLKDGCLHYIQNYVGLERFKVGSDKAVSPGKHNLRFEFEPTGKPDFKSGKGSPGHARLFMDGELIAQTHFPYTTPNMFGVLGLSCGYAAYDSVDPKVYRVPFTFTGEIERVVLDLSTEQVARGEVAQTDSELKRMMTEQ